MLFLSTSRMTGTRRPAGVSTATPIWMNFLKMISWFSRSALALNRGKCFRADAATFMMNGVMVSLCSGVEYFLRRFSSSVMLALANWVTCGMADQAKLSRWAAVLRSWLIGWRSTVPHLENPAEEGPSSRYPVEGRSCPVGRPCLPAGVPLRSESF